MERVRTITVGIAASEVLIRTALSGILEGAGDIIVAGQARDGAAAVELARCSRPQVLLMDATSPGLDGLATARLVRRQAPSTQVLLLAGSANGELLFPALQAGASGFLLRNSEPNDVVNAVRAVAAGDAVLPPPAIRRLVDRCVGDGAERRDKARRRIGALTNREQDVLVHLAKGMSNAAIARTMCLSEGAVKAHVSRLLAKLRCDNRVQAALIAWDAGMPG
jgi:DNA-binding NarL/FixJ family response regulator